MERENKWHDGEWWVMKKLSDYLFYSDDWAEIYCGDCLEIMPLMEPESVDLVVTSPPFNASKDYELASDNREDYDEWIKKVCMESQRVVSIALYFFISQTKMDVVKQCLSGFQMWLFWHRPNLVSSGSKIMWPWIPTITPIAMAWKNGRKPMLNEVQGIRTFDLIVATSPQSSFGGELHREHPTQDPIEAYKPIIARTQGNIVFDPFLGSGTTCVAAKKMNRKSIGIEINPKYCEISVKRLRQEVFDFRKEKK